MIDAMKNSVLHEKSFQVTQISAIHPVKGLRTAFCDGILVISRSAFSGSR
jgi:hypothetical protein